MSKHSQPDLRAATGPRNENSGRRVAALVRPALPVGLAVALGAAFAAPVEIKLPPETARLTESRLPGYALAVTHCSTCHSPDYIPMQPPSTRTYWQAAVTKMQKTFGAPIPDSAVAPIVDYLAQTYGSEPSQPSTPPAKK